MKTAAILHNMLLDYDRLNLENTEEFWSKLDPDETEHYEMDILEKYNKKKCLNKQRSMHSLKTILCP